MFVVTCKQMYNAECNAQKRGISFPQLMENAGCACADIIRDKFGISDKSSKKVLVLCGKGKNGGDGFVIARRLCEYGADVTVMLVCGEPKAEDSVSMFAKLNSFAVEVFRYNGSADTVKPLVARADIIVDCMFGTGFDGMLPGPASALTELVNASNSYVVAIDVPSGANCDSAKIIGEAIRADLTVAISAYKPIHIMKPFCEYCGECVIADIGITKEDFASLGKLICFSCDDNDIKELMPVRKSVSNKGTYGHALCICGSKMMQGACVLSANAALRSGCGLVTAAFPDDAYPAVAPKITEALLLPLDSNADGTLASSSLQKLNDAAARANAVLLGCGIGFNSETKELVCSFLCENTKPIIIDADGINAVATNINVLKALRAPAVLTPHPGEMSRLCGKSIGEIVLNPIQCAIDFALEYKVTVVLKGANTVVCTPDPINVYINPTGNSGLAKGGSGDFLAGMIVSFVAQGMSLFDASVAAVYLHGKCADITAAELSMRGMLPGDMLTRLPKLLSNFE